MSKLVDWLSQLDTKRITYEIMKKYMCEIKWHHVNLNYFSQENEIFTHSLLQRICKNVKRRQNQVERRERRSITRNVLFKMLTKLNTNILVDVNMHATFCLTFANFFRVNEFIYIKVDTQTNDFEN